MARHRSRRVGRSGSATAVAAGVSVLALALLYPVARTAGEAMERIPPPGEVIALKLATAQAKRPDLALPPSAVQAAQAAIVAEPIAYEPVFIAARAAEGSGRLADAVKLMEEVRRRRPSFSTGRLLLMGYYGRLGRYGDAFREADVAMRLSPEAQKHIIPVVAGMLPHAEARRGLARTLAGNPPWREDFLTTAKKTARPEHAADLLQEVRKLRPPHGSALEAGLFVESLVRVGRYGEARAAWASLLPPADRNRAGLVFDGDFAGSKAPAPFNWSFGSSPAGRGEVARATGSEPAQLVVSHFGGQPTVLAEQTLVLTPGRYLLTVDAKGDRPEISGEIVWRIACLEGTADLGALRLQRFRSAFVRERLDFSVPAGCGAQKLTVTGVPGDLAEAVTASFARVRIARGG